MSNRVNEHEIVELLAASTDRLLKGEKPAEAVTTAATKETAELLNTVERLARLMPPPRPEGEVRNRIRAKLSARWNETGPGTRQKSSLIDFFTKRDKMVYGWGAVAIAALFIIGILATPAAFPAQSGAASYQPAALIAGVVILGIIGLVLWWFRRRP